MLSRSSILGYLCLLWPTVVFALSHAHLAELRNATTQVFHHGWDNYMRVAFPEDEVRKHLASVRHWKQTDFASSYARYPVHR